MAKNAIGMAIACEEYGAKFFANGAAPGGVLEHPGTIKDPQRVRESWQSTFGAVSYTHLDVYKRQLQGFPDWWCAGFETDEPSEEEIKFWTEVFETHRSVMGKSSRPKSRNQIIKWLKNPHSDSAEYKMWGNGVALPNVYFVLSGIVYYSQFPDFLL